MFHECFKKMQELNEQKMPFVLVTLVHDIGSTPNSQGAKMIVTRQGRIYGTVGGGKIEKKAIEEANTILSSKKYFQKSHFVEWNLTKDVGMTCGGSVKLFFEAVNIHDWHIVIFGAGHVSQALIHILQTLDCIIICIDPREEWLSQIPKSDNIITICSKDMPKEVSHLPESAFVLLLTMGHNTDKPILIEILKTRNFPYVGALGSKRKAHILFQDILEAGLSEQDRERYYCPVGLDIGNNSPNEIAISIVAQLLQKRDSLKKVENYNDQISTQ